MRRPRTAPIGIERAVEYLGSEPGPPAGRGRDVLRYRNIDLGNLLGRAGFYGGVLLIVFGAYQIWLQRDRLSTA